MDFPRPDPIPTMGWGGATPPYPSGPDKGTTSVLLDDRFEQALRSNEPVNRLRSLALSFLAEGHDRPAVLELFENARQQLRLAGRETDEDAVMDVMDMLAGWCSPHMELPVDRKLND